MNPSYLILKALAKVLPISLDSLINPDVSPEDEGANQMKMLYCSCPSEMRETLLHLSLIHILKRNWRNKKTHYSADLDRMIMPIGNQISPEVAQGFF